MIADYHYAYLGKIRSGLTLLILPIQLAVDYPVRMVGAVQSLIRSKEMLIQENVQLHYQQTLLESKLQKLLTIKKENAQLRELLLASSKVNMKSMAAQILAVEASDVRQMVILDKGKREGIYLGQPVLDAKGIIGQVIDVGYLTSTVLLISDIKSALSVSNHRTGEHAILVGSSRPQQLSLINLPKTASVQRGDLLVTSGLERLYPEGYPVGKVKSVKNIPGEAFIRVKVEPMADLNKNRLVVLIWPDKDQAALTEQMKERLLVLGAMS